MTALWVQEILLDKHRAADTFPGRQEQNIGRPIKSRIILLARNLFKLEAIVFMYSVVC